MAIQNIFSNLADPKTKEGTVIKYSSFKDFQNEQIQRDLAKQQFLNAQQTNPAQNLQLEQARQQQDISNRIRQAGQQAIKYDDLGNPTIDNTKLGSAITAIDPLTGIKFTQDNSKAIKDLSNLDLESKIKQEDLRKKTLDNISSFTQSSLQGLQSATPETFEAIKQYHIDLANQLGIKNNVASWTYENRDNLIRAGLQAKDNIDLQIQKINTAFEQGLKTKEFGLKQDKETREQLKAQQDLTQESRKQTLELNKIFKNDYLEPYNKLKDKAEQVLTLLKTKKGIADTGALYTFLKVLDSAGAVTGSDYDAIRGVGGPVEKIQSLSSELTNNGILTDEKRNQLSGAISQILGVAENRFKQGISDTKYQSEGLGLPLDQIIGRNSYEKFVGELPIKQTQIENRRNNPLGGLPNAPQASMPNNPFSRDANVPPPNYPISIANQNGQIEQINTNTQPKIALPTRFTELPISDRKKIQARAKAIGLTPQEYYTKLQSQRQ